jgi:hypothetical protein
MMQLKPYSVFTTNQVAEITKHVSNSNDMVYDTLIEYINASKNTNDSGTSNITPNLVGPSVNQSVTPYPSQTSVLTTVLPYPIYFV